MSWPTSAGIDVRQRAADVGHLGNTSIEASATMIHGHGRSA